MNLSVDIHIHIIIIDPVHPDLKALPSQLCIVEELICDVGVKEGGEEDIGSLVAIS